MNKKGFSAVEGLVVLLIVVFIGAAGWFVWQRQNDKQANSAQTSPASSQSTAEAFTDCHTEIDKVSKKTASGMALYEWKTIEHTKVVLSDWHTTLTLPKSMVGKAVCRYTPNGYEFSTKAIVNDDKCVEYYRNEELLSEGIELARYPADTVAAGLFGPDVQGTLEDYYTTHKASDGNYLTVPGTSRHYYKVGGNFYVASGYGTNVPDKYKAARAAACPNEKPDFAQPLMDAVATIKQR